MEKNKTNASWIFLGLLSFFIVIIYSNTLNVPFILDDRHNILERKNLHLTKISIDNLTDTFFNGDGVKKKIYRPLSSLSLALNYYFGRFNVTGYHAVNIFIHIVTSAVLFNILTLLLKAKKYNLDSPKIISIAGLTTILWASHPIQTQTVTYIVQRMASLSAMFYLIGIWWYLKFRNSDFFPKSCFWGILSLCSFICALLSKENAVIFPFGILLIELFFLDGFKKVKKKPLKSIFTLSLILVIPLSFFLYSTNWTDILSGYDYRPFTLKQRLLTEPRILFFYISQLLYPIPERFSISHSFLLSNSFFSPLSTVYSITGILFFPFIALQLRQKIPLIGFPILFFFLHHIVESTIIPLELVFEHRNYLPSVFFFLPFSYGLIKLIFFYKKKSSFIISAIFFFCCSIIFLCGLSTYVRNSVWVSHESMWKNAAKTSPDLIRPYSQLGWYYTNEKRMNVNKALFYFKQGLNKKKSYHVFEDAFLWMNIALSYEKAQNFPAAKNAALNSLHLFSDTVNRAPSLKNKTIANNQISTIHYYLSKIYFSMKDQKQALFHINEALNLNNSPLFLNAKANYQIHSEQYLQANKLLQASLKMASKGETFFLLGKTLTRIGNYSSGLWFYKNALKRMRGPRENSTILLYISENRYLSGDSVSARRILYRLVRQNSIIDLNALVTGYKRQSNIKEADIVYDELIRILKKELPKIQADHE